MIGRRSRAAGLNIDAIGMIQKRGYFIVSTFRNSPLLQGAALWVGLIIISTRFCLPSYANVTSSDQIKSEPVVIGKFKVELASPAKKGSLPTKTLSYFEEMLTPDEIDETVTSLRAEIERLPDSLNLKWLKSRLLMAYNPQEKDEYVFWGCGKGITQLKPTLDHRKCESLISGKRRAKQIQFEYKVMRVGSLIYPMLEITGGFERTLRFLNKNPIPSKARVFIRTDSWGDDVATTPEIDLYAFKPSTIEALKSRVLGKAWGLLGSSLQMGDLYDLSRRWEDLQQKQSQLYFGMNVFLIVPNIFTFGTAAYSSIAVALAKQTAPAVLKATIFGAMFLVNTIGDITMDIKVSENWHKRDKYAFYSLRTLYYVTSFIEVGQYFPALIPKGLRIHSKQAQNWNKLQKISSEFIPQGVFKRWYSKTKQRDQVLKRFWVLKTSGTDKFRMVEKVSFLEEIELRKLNYVSEQLTQHSMKLSSSSELHHSWFFKIHVELSEKHLNPLRDALYASGSFFNAEINSSFEALRMANGLLDEHAKRINTKLLKDLKRLGLDEANANLRELYERIKSFDGELDKLKQILE